jgi:hypothetical protein
MKVQRDFLLEFQFFEKSEKNDDFDDFDELIT